MNEIQIFNSPEFGEIRTIIEDGKPLFCGSDVAKALGYSNTSDALKRHCKGVVKRDTLTNGGMQSLNYITEGDLYRLATNSELPSAERFEAWVYDEVLPSIRKHGGYLTPAKIEEALLNPDTIIMLATQLKAEREQRKQLENTIEAQRPKVAFANAVDVAKNSILIGDLAKILKQNGIVIGQNRLFQWLRDNEYLMKRGSSKNMPTQRSMEAGWFEVKESCIANPDGSIRITKTTKVTGKGQIYFVNLFLNQEEAV